MYRTSTKIWLTYFYGEIFHRFGAYGPKPSQMYPKKHVFPLSAQTFEVIYLGRSEQTKQVSRPWSLLRRFFLTDVLLETYRA